MGINLISKYARNIYAQFIIINVKKKVKIKH